MKVGMFKGVAFGYLGIFCFEFFLGDLRTDKVVEGIFEMSIFLENFEVFFGSEVVGLIAIANKIGDENFFSLGFFEGSFNT